MWDCAFAWFLHLVCFCYESRKETLPSRLRLSIGWWSFPSLRLPWNVEDRTETKLPVAHFSDGLMFKGYSFRDFAAPVITKRRSSRVHSVGIMQEFRFKDNEHPQPRLLIKVFLSVKRRFRRSSRCQPDKFSIFGPWTAVLLQIQPSHGADTSRWNEKYFKLLCRTTGHRQHWKQKTASGALLSDAILKWFAINTSGDGQRRFFFCLEDNVFSCL